MRNAKKPGKRSPLDRDPLRNPGESLQEEMQELLDSQLAPTFILAIGFVFFAAWEWRLKFTKSPPQPELLTFLAVLLIGYSTYQFFSVRRKLRSMKLGLVGEKLVGQFLEDLRRQGCRVFHDIVGKEFNLDHVVVGPQGVFVIETKTYSKPDRGQTIVDYDGERIRVNGIEPDRNAIIQARAARNWLDNLLSEATGRRFPMRGVVLLPGWYVKQTKDGQASDIWVLNPKALKSFMEHEPAVLKGEDVALISSRLTDYVTR